MDVSGLEINQNSFRAIKLVRSGNNLKIGRFAETPLPVGIISDNKILDSQKFTNFLANFLKANHFFGSSHWIVTLPCGAIYTTYKIFPNLSREDLEEAVEINANSLLPGNLAELSWGWQEIQPLEKIAGREVMVASISKKELGEYLGVLTKIGIVPMAIEPKSCAIARVLGKTPNTLVLNLEGAVLTSVVLNGGFVSFAREFLIEAPPKNQFKIFLSEVRKVINFYLTEKKETKIERIILDGSGATSQIAEALEKTLKIETKLASELIQISGTSLPSLAILGVGLRALADPRGDTDLSLLPVSAKEASQAKRVLMFYGGLTNIIVITAVLFLLLFLGTWGFLIYLNQQADLQLANLTNQNLAGVDEETALIQKNIKELNPQIERQAQLEDQLTYWSSVFKGLGDSLSSGVTLTQINFAGTGETLNIMGSAQSREALVSFRDLLGGQAFVESVQMPTSTFGENQKINFTLTLTLKKDALKRQ